MKWWQAGFRRVACPLFTGFKRNIRTADLNNKLEFSKFAIDKYFNRLYVSI